MHGQLDVDPDQETMLPAHVLVVHQDSSSKLYGYAARDGRTIKAGFEDAEPFRDGYAVVKFKGAWGVIDTTGGFALEAKYAQVMPPVDGSTVAFQSGSPDPCVIKIRSQVKCLPYAEYWLAWKQQLRASAVPDKELILRILEMNADPLSRQKEIITLEDTYVLMDEVRAKATRQLLGN